MYKDFKKTESLDTGFTSGNSLLWMFSGIILGLIVGLGMYFFTNDKISNGSMIDTLQKKIQTAQSETAKPQKPVTSSETANKRLPQKNKQPLAEEKRQNKFSYYAVLPNLDVPVGTNKPINTSQQVVKNTTTQSTAQQRPQDTEQTALAKSYDEAVRIQNAANQQLAPEPVAQKVQAKESIGDYVLQVASFRKQSMADKTRGRLSNRGIDAYVQKKKVKGRYWYRVLAGPVDQISVDSWKTTAEKLGHKPLIISVR